MTEFLKARVDRFYNDNKFVHMRIHFTQAEQIHIFLYHITDFKLSYSLFTDLGYLLLVRIIAAGSHVVPFRPIIVVSLVTPMALVSQNSTMNFLVLSQLLFSSKRLAACCTNVWSFIGMDTTDMTS